MGPLITELEAQLTSETSLLTVSTWMPRSCLTDVTCLMITRIIY